MRTSCTSTLESVLLLHVAAAREWVDAGLLLLRLLPQHAWQLQAHALLWCSLPHATQVVHANRCGWLARHTTISASSHTTASIGHEAHRFHAWPLRLSSSGLLARTLVLHNLKRSGKALLGRHHLHHLLLLRCQHRHQLCGGGGTGAA